MCPHRIELLWYIVHMDDGSTPLSRRDQLLGMIQAEFPSYHPLLAIARIGHHGEADLKLQFECHKTIAKYVEPELKSLEVKGELGHRHRVSVSLFGEAQETPVEALPAGSSEDHRIPQIIDVEPEVIDRVVRAW